MATEATSPARLAPLNRPRLLERYFYFSMSVLTCAVVIYGFSHTVAANLFHPEVARPFVLYVHAAVFTGWLGFFVLQSALVRTHNVRWHRRVGVLGIALGTSVFAVGVTTSLVMARFNRGVMHKADQDLFLAIPLWDMLCFATTFALAIVWRKRPEYHRRLILLATCALTAAGWGRFPQLPGGTFYAGVDFLIVLGIVRDLVVNRSVHPVYRYGLPAFIAGQSLVVAAILKRSDLWLTIAHKLVG